MSLNHSQPFFKWKQIPLISVGIEYFLHSVLSTGPSCFYTFDSYEFEFIGEVSISGTVNINLYDLPAESGVELK